jgi:predicted  nucleic acid-binding Zn-ribbon protein
MIAVPADAAVKISNGVACKKSGQTTKTSGGTYRCAKNPLVSSTKLTWLSIDCLTAANDAVKARKASVTTIANFKAQLPVIDLGITTELANKAEIQVKLDEANKRLVAAQAKLTAATTDADKKILTTAVGSWTSAARAYSSKIRNIDLTIKKLESAKLAATNKPAELEANVADARESAKLICTKGF